jgi:hypothetical protein
MHLDVERGVQQQHGAVRVRAPQLRRLVRRGKRAAARVVVPHKVAIPLPVSQHTPLSIKLMWPNSPARAQITAEDMCVAMLMADCGIAGWKLVRDAWLLTLPLHLMGPLHDG